MDAPTPPPQRHVPLVILAAGLSSRYGDLKQLVPLGPSGEALMDYGIYDAWRAAGATEVILVVREEIEARIREHVQELVAGAMKVTTLFQDPDDLPGDAPPSPDREKPWGTGHAVWTARSGVGRGPFMLMNADDFYGRDAFDSLGEWTERVISSTELGLVPYRLGDSLSEHGGVHRGVCRINQHGWLEGIREVLEIRRRPDPPPGEPELEGRDRDGERVLLEEDRLYSANLWGFTPAVFPLMERGLERFLEEHGHDPEAEFLIADGLRPGLENVEIGVRVLEPGTRVLGVTHPEDREPVAAALERMVERGHYPGDLREGFTHHEGRPGGP